MIAGREFPRLDGLIAAPFTAFDRAGGINLGEISRQADLLAAQGVIGAYVSGTTGEGVSCTVAERKAVMEEWARQARGRLFLIVHVGALSLGDARELAAHAQRIGADATAAVPANFFKPATVGALVDYVGAVASAAPGLPFYYYHTTMSGVSLPMPAFLEAADGRVPNLAGIKFNSPDLYEFQNCVRACGGRYDIIWGVDESYAGAVVLGARAAIGSTYNYAAPIYLEIRKSVAAGDFDAARAGMAKVCRIVDILNRCGGVAAGKAMMAVHGLDMGDVRLPLRALTAAEKEAVAGELRGILGIS